MTILLTNIGSPCTPSWKSAQTACLIGQFANVRCRWELFLAKLTLILKDDQFTHKKLSQFGRIDEFHLWHGLTDRAYHLRQMVSAWVCLSSRYYLRQMFPQNCSYATWQERILKIGSLGKVTLPPSPLNPLRNSQESRNRWVKREKYIIIRSTSLTM